MTDDEIEVEVKPEADTYADSELGLQIKIIKGREDRSYTPWLHDKSIDDADKISNSNILRLSQKSYPEDGIYSLLRAVPCSNESVETHTLAISQLTENLPEKRRRFKLVPMAIHNLSKDRDAGIHLCLEAIRSLLNAKTAELPSPRYLESLYLRQLKIDEDIKPFVDAVTLCNRMATYSLLKSDFLKSLNWLCEVDKIYSCQEFLCSPGHLPWEVRLFAPPCLEYSTRRMFTCYTFSFIYSQLSNTAAASYYAYFGHFVIPYLYKDPVPEIQRRLNLMECKSKCSQRHPPLDLIVDWDVDVPELQARGTWTQLSSMPNKEHIPRHSCSTFIWKSRLYVFGGTQRHEKRNYDFWYCDLVKLDGWKQLPDLPTPGGNRVNMKMCYRNLLMNMQMRLYKNRAYLFTGTNVLYFDLEAGSWTPVRSNGMRQKDKPWPYPRPEVDPFYLQNYCMAIFEDKIYIFGGNSLDAQLGTNILMMFDLNTGLWEHLSGNSEARGIMVMPQFRTNASSWIVPRQRKMYILYGRVPRQKIHHDLEEQQECDWNYDDMWSYHLDERIWRRECIRGNFPSPRAYIGSIYHSTMDKTIIFGGCSDLVPTYDDDEPELPFAYSIFGDTFILDPDTLVWKHILTREFPTYRFGSSFAVDGDTGKTYLFGGTTCTSFVPSKKAKSETKSETEKRNSSQNRIFGDIWRLDIDIPSGGDFDKKVFYKDMDAERVKVGPWERCFGCKKFVVGKMMRCAGTCEGAVIFCSVGCQRNAWVRHKELYHCRRKEKEEKEMTQIVNQLAKDDACTTLSQDLQKMNI